MHDPGPAVEGYFGRSSYAPGDEVTLHCGATVARPSGRVAPGPSPIAFDVELARLGGQRDVVLCLDGLVAPNHPIPDDAAAHGARWPATVTFPAGDWASGWYEARLRGTRDDGTTVERRAGFVLRPQPSRPAADILIQLSLNTWNAYNDWGRSNLYTGGTHVSFRRPTAHGFLWRPDALRHRNANIAAEPDLGGDAWLAHAREHGISSWSACAGWPTWEGPFIEWAERAGYRFDFAANADIEDSAELLASHRLLLSVGHDEYWTSAMRDAVEGYIAGGGNVAFFSGNTSFWQVRYEDGGDTMVGYKDSARREDPLRKSRPDLLTGMWSDPIIGRPETAMTGVSFTRGGYARQAGCTPRGQRGYTVWRPEHWLFEGTDLRYGDLLGADDCVVGYECDGCELTLQDGLPVPTHADGCPPGFEVLATAPARLYSVDLEAGVNEYPTGLQKMRTVGELQGVAHVLFGDATPANVRRVADGAAVLGTYEAGGTVVTTGCTDWAYGVAGGDPIVQRITSNILDRLGRADLTLGRSTALTDRERAWVSVTVVVDGDHRPGGPDLHDGPLTGITVVDMTVAIQGPHAGAYLADMGADVVKVERPGGELNRYVRGPGFASPPDVMGTQYVAMNRGKRGIAIDAHSLLGREVMRRLMDRADVFVTNYRREALDRMGLGYDEVAARNPRLVYARVSGFGPLGPDAGKAMLDGAAQARGGLAAISGPSDGPPMPPGAAIADHSGSMQLALGIMTALYARERTGRGQEVNTSALGALMWIQAWEITHTTMSDETLRREGQHNPNIRCPYGIYETKDGGAFLLAVAMSDESWDDFWLFVDRPEVVVDPRWNTGAKRIGARGVTDGVDEIRQKVREAFASRTTAEWTDFLASQPEIIYERIQNYNELVVDPQVAANGYLIDVDVPKFGTARVVSNVVHLSDTPGGGVRRPPPLLGEHTAEVMDELGFSRDEIDEVLASVAGAADQIIAAIFDD